MKTKNPEALVAVSGVGVFGCLRMPAAGLRPSGKKEAQKRQEWKQAGHQHLRVANDKKNVRGGHAAVKWGSGERG